MSPILILAIKDLRRRMADPSGVLTSLAIPLAIAGAMALTFGSRPGSGEEPAPPRLRYVVVDQDGSPLSGILASATQNPQAAEHMDARTAPTREEGLRLLRDEEFTALLVIPKGFAKTLLEGGRTELELIKNPAQTMMPVAAQQAAEVLALYLSGAARLLQDEGPRFGGLLEGEGWQDTAALTALITTLRDRVTRLGALLLPPLIEVRSEKEARQSSGGFDLMGWMYPGMIVMALLFTGLTQMKDLLRESQAGTLRRLLAAPLGPVPLLAAKILSVGLVVAVAHALLLAVGWIAFGMRWGRPGPLLAVSALLVLAVTGFSALVYALVRTERQGDAFGGILTMVMSMLGGAFVPLEVYPDWLARIARFTVNYWGNLALRGVASGGGFADIAGSIGVLAALGAIMTGLGVVLLGRRHVKGAL